MEATDSRYGYPLVAYPSTPACTHPSSVLYVPESRAAMAWQANASSVVNQHVRCATYTRLHAGAILDAGPERQVGPILSNSYQEPVKSVIHLISEASNTVPTFRDSPLRQEVSLELS